MTATSVVIFHLEKQIICSTINLQELSLSDSGKEIIFSQIFSLSAPGAFAIELVKASLMEPEHNLIKSNDQESSYDVLTKYMAGNQFRKGAECSFVHQM